MKKKAFHFLTNSWHNDVKIKEGVAADKIATSPRANKNAGQAVRATKPSIGALYHIF